MAEAQGRAPEERLFNLVLALMATRNGLTKAEIFSSVQGYSEAYTVGADTVALDRKFERDKKTLRDTGIPLETHDTEGEPGNNQNTRYLISADDYRLPDGVELTAQDVSLLNLAASVWREGSMSADSRRALLKLRSLGIEADEPLIGVAPNISVREPAFDALQAAVNTAEVAFDYLKPGDTAARRRRVRPLALVQFEERWHLYAYDIDVEAPRNFLLSRIVSDVKEVGTFVDDATEDHQTVALGALERIWADQQAVLRVREHSIAAGRLQRLRAAVQDDGDWVIHYLDLQLLADELAGYGPEVFIVSPPELRNAVVDRLTLVLERHSAVVDG